MVETKADRIKRRYFSERTKVNSVSPPQWPWPVLTAEGCGNVIQEFHKIYIEAAEKEFQRVEVHRPGLVGVQN